MGCCNGRTEEIVKVTTETYTFETKNPIEYNREEKEKSSNARNQLSLREIIQKPISGTPDAKIRSSLRLHKAFNKGENRISFLASTEEGRNLELPELGNEKFFEIKAFKFEEAWQMVLFDFVETLTRIMRKKLANIVYIFNSELLAEDHFLLKSMIQKDKLNILNKFNLLIYKEFVPLKLNNFIEKNLISPGLLEENLVFNVLFAVAEGLRVMREIGLEFDDLNEDYFVIDIKTTKFIKFDPTMRAFSKNGSPIVIYNQIYCAPENKKISENLVKNNEITNIQGKGSVFSLGALLLRIIIGKELKLCGNVNLETVKSNYNELLTMKYPKAWYLIEKMIEENPEKRISLEEVLEKANFIKFEEDFLFLSRNFDFEEEKEKQEGISEYDDFDQFLSLSEGNSMIFQPSSALEILESLKSNLIQKSCFLSDFKFIEISLRRVEILMNEENFSEALEELHFLKNLLELQNPSPKIDEIKLKMKFSMALCYKYLNKLAKCQDLLMELSKEEKNSDIVKIKSNNELVDLYISEKNFPLAKKILKLTHTLFTNSAKNEHEQENTDKIVEKKDVNEVEKFSLKADSFELQCKLLMFSDENYEGALENMRKSHQIRKKIYNSEHSCIIKSYKLLALCFLNVGEIKEATKAINKNLNLLKIREMVFFSIKNDFKFRTMKAESLKILSKLQLDMGNVDKSEQTYKEIIEIYEENFGFYSQKMVKEMQNLANFYSSIGSYSKAKETYNIVFEIIKNLYGEKSIEAAQNMYLLGDFYEQIGSYSEGIESLLDSLKLRLEISGGLNEEMTDLLIKISNNYAFLGFHSKAVEYGEKALELLRGNMGIKEEIKMDMSINSRQNTPIKSTLSTKNDEDIIEESEKEIKKIVLIEEEIPGRNKRKVKNSLKEQKKILLIECLFMLGSLYRKMGLSNKSKAYFEEQRKYSLF